MWLGTKRGSQGDLMTQILNDHLLYNGLAKVYEESYYRVVNLAMMKTAKECVTNY